VSSVPVQLTSLVGRELELAALSELLEGVRLLTVTGVGGVGKTRLAAALADRSAETFGDSVWWVELADLDDAELVGERVAASVGVRDLPASDPLEAIAERVGGGPSLLVLDNCEQLAAACAQLVGGLLRVCTQLTVLATSRLTLALPGEQVFRIGGLPVRRGGPGAIELFLQRARRFTGAFEVDEPALSAVASICERVDGMPLAIELAAARTPVLNPAEIDQRLEGSLRLLRRDGSGVPERQRSLEATLGWSHRLLTPPQRAVFRRLAVFRGTFALSAAEAVAADGDIGRDDVLEALAGLVDHSLVQGSRGAVETRYGLLSTVRSYAEEQLGASGEADDARARHAEYYLGLLEAAGPGPDGAQQVPALDRLDAEHDNLRAALATCLITAPETAGRLAGRLSEFWYRRGHYHEARRWLDQVALRARELTPATRAAVLAGAGVFAFLQCEYATATERLEGALALYRTLGDRAGVAQAQQRLGSIARERGRYEHARELHEQSLALWEQLGDDGGVGASLDYLGFVAWLAGDFARAQELSGRAAVMFRARGELQQTAAALINVGAAAHYDRDDERAVELLEEALALSVECGYKEGVAWALHERAIVAGREHDLGRAAEMLLESLRLHRGLGDRWRTVSVIEELGGALLLRAEPNLAATLLGAAEAARERLDAPVPTAERPDLERARRVLRRALPAGELHTAWERGHALTLDDAADDAAAAARRLFVSCAAPRTGLDDLLTGRERAVLKLVSEGLTNREIGAALQISTSTAGVHVSNILRKLRVGRRAQAAARAHELGLLGEPQAAT
jgi:predicted ATPase/DNA-binding CsgD family transcriptional regulator